MMLDTRPSNALYLMPYKQHLNISNAKTPKLLFTMQYRLFTPNAINARLMHLQTPFPPPSTT